MPLFWVVAQRTRQVFSGDRPCTRHDVRCRFHSVRADVVPPGRLGVGQKLGEGVFAYNGLVPRFKFLLGLRRPCGRLKLIEHGTLDGSVHPAVVGRGRDLLRQVAAIPAPQHPDVNARLRGVLCKHPSVGLVDGRMVVELDGLGFGERPIVFGCGQGLHDGPSPGVARVVMAGDGDAVVGRGGVVGRADKSGGRVDRFGVDVKAVPFGDIEVGIGAVQSHLGVHPFWANRKLGAGPPCNVPLLVAVQHVESGRMDQGRVGFETVESLLP